VALDEAAAQYLEMSWQIRRALGGESWRATISARDNSVALSI
jgi:hypothetical protein